MEMTRRKVVVGILIVAFVATAVPGLTGLLNAAAADGSVTYTKAAPTAGGFYDGLGDIYTVKTGDGVKIKMLRYHPAKQAFNTGKQPILLLPGMACNLNTYISHTTERILDFFTPTLPTDLAAWAKGDTNIAKDPLLYYSAAYYLHKQGYDVWLMNYRGVGMEEATSEMGDIDESTIDTFAFLDARAALNCVYQVTKLHPVCGGHSTGGTVFVMLLEGAYFNWDGHVKSSSSLQRQRNGITVGAETIKGFIGFEPAGVPVVTSLLDSSLIWAVLLAGLNLDLRDLCETLDDLGQLSTMNFLANLMGMIEYTALGQAIGTYLNMDPNNSGDVLTYYFLRYVADTMYLCMLGQYNDWAQHETIREYYQNGIENNIETFPDTPHWLDGYFYYNKNLKLWKIPSIIFLATMQNEYFDLVNKDAIIRDYVNGKTVNAKDKCYIATGAHIEFPMGKSAPGSIFPQLGAWLKTL